MTRHPLLRSRNVEITLGIGFLFASVWLIYDAYEGRGKERPFWAHFIP